jgi:hypothetical protein
MSNVCFELRLKYPTSSLKVPSGFLNQPYSLRWGDYVTGNYMPASAGGRGSLGQNAQNRSARTMRLNY